jgi:hypothetical protein
MIILNVYCKNKIKEITNCNFWGVFLPFHFQILINTFLQRIDLTIHIGNDFKFSFGRLLNNASRSCAPIWNLWEILKYQSECRFDYMLDYSKNIDKKESITWFDWNAMWNENDQDSVRLIHNFREGGKTENKKIGAQARRPRPQTDWTVSWEMYLENETSRIVLISNNISRQSHYFVIITFWLLKLSHQWKWRERFTKTKNVWEHGRNDIFGKFLSQTFSQELNNKQNKNNYLFPIHYYRIII